MLRQAGPRHMGQGGNPVSFYVEFTAASHDDALRIVVAEEFLPDCVRAFICQALEAYRTAGAIYVKAVGHLYTKDYDVSSAEILVREVKLRRPKPEYKPGSSFAPPAYEREPVAPALSPRGAGAP